MLRRDLSSATIVLAAAWAVAGLAGCSGGLKCPAGTVKDGNTCRAVADVPLVDVWIPDVPTPDDAEDDARDDVVAGDTVTDGASDERPIDIPMTENFPGGVIGKSCTKNSNCQNEVVDDGVCLGWDQTTYCSRLDCQEAGSECPEGALCMGITVKTPACAVACESDGDCRWTEGIFCKLLPDLSGAMVQICHGVVRDPGGIGDPCIGPSDCAGAMGCLTNFEAGYCTMLQCGAEAPCPEGAECIRVGGNPVCLKQCVEASDCEFRDDVVRACVELKSAVTGDRVKVCGSGTSGVAIGEQCLNDTECTTNDCHVSFLGLCPDSTIGCTTGDDCELGVCLTSAETSFGYCTKTCSVSVACPVPSVCVETVGESGFLEAECVPSCGEDASCRVEAGLVCRYGDPLLNPGRFACARLDAGAIGMACTDDDECASGDCLQAAGQAAGFCSSACLSGGKCPFPTACDDRGQGYKCLLRCRGDSDCPDGQTCKAGKVTTVCAP